MIRFLVVVAILAIFAALLFVGWSRVPGIAEGGRLTATALFDGYMQLLGLVLTVAIITPLTAQFVKWREDNEWRAARTNAGLRLHATLSEIFSCFRAWLRHEEHDVNVDFFRSNLARQLAAFFDAYDDEYPTFTAPMHSAASNIRRRLVALQRSLRTIDFVVEPTRSARIELGQPELDTIRALSGQPPLPDGDSIGGEDPAKIVVADHYFKSVGRIFLDVRLDTRIGAGVVDTKRFEPVDFSAIRSEWRAFIAEIKDSSAFACLPSDMPAPDEQCRAFVRWLDKRPGENYMLDLIMPSDERAKWREASPD